MHSGMRKSMHRPVQPKLDIIIRGDKTLGISSTTVNEKQGICYKST